MPVMNPVRASRHPLARALWANALALGLLAGALLLRGEQSEAVALPGLLPAAFAQDQPIAGGGGLYLMPAQLASNVWGVYVMDVDRQSLMVYHFDPAGKRLNFVAARELTHDRMLGNYNTFPDPLEIRNIAEKEREKGRLPGDNNP
jgi:hypothetical protein